jgi:CubicO group peptidase (beta-lactamase class C family)/beta-glucosidase-like glycosyl hydrolase
VGLLPPASPFAVSHPVFQASTVPADQQADQSWSRSVSDTLTLSQKVAQLLVIQESPGLETNEVLERAVREGIGGIRICERSPLLQADYLNSLQYRARIPLLITQNTSCSHPSYRSETADILPLTALGAVQDGALVRSYTRMIGQRARLTGVHKIYGPEASTLGIFEQRAQETGPPLSVETDQLVSAYLEGVTASGLLSTAGLSPARHRSSAESYLLPVIGQSSGPSAPRAGVELLRESVPDITVAWPRPASAQTNLLGRLQESTSSSRVVTVDLSVSGRTYSRDELHRVAVEALRAGADQLVIRPNDRTVHRTLVQAIRDGVLSRSKVDSSVTSILQTKEARRLHERRDVDLNAVSEQTAPRHWTVMNREVSRRSLTLLSNPDRTVPLSPVSAGELLHVTLTEDSRAEDGRYFRRQLRSHSPSANVVHHVIDRSAGAQAYDRAIMDSTPYEAIVVSLFLQQNLSSRQRVLIEEMTARDLPVIVVNFGEPRLAADLNGPEAVLLAWAQSQPVQEVAAQALFGKTSVTGRLPFTISSRYPKGIGTKLEQQTLREGAPEEVGMRSRPLETIDRLLHGAVADSAFPGAALAIGRTGVLTKLRGYGYETYESSRPVTPESIFDLASLTKVVAPTTAAMKLYESGQLNLRAPVSEYWPAFAQHEKGDITIRHLLTHTSGLRPFYHPYTQVFATPFFEVTRPFTPFFRMEIQSRDDMFKFIARDTLQYDPGEQYRYSDLNMITLMHVIERVTGMNMGDYLQEHVFGPLGMNHTSYRGTGPAAMSPDVVPTEVDRTFRARLIRGEVHDEAAYIMGGTSGHAGLFSTASDLAVFAHMLLNGGTVHGKRILEPETIDRFTRPVAPDDHTRALGWDTKSPTGYSSSGELMGPNSFGHTGFTGTSFWIDPDQELFVILLTNRVHPTRANRGHISIRPEVADRAFRAIQGPADILISELLNLP